MRGLATVFGGSGFLGRYAVRALAKDGWRIRVAMRRPHLAPELRVMGEVGQIELYQANVRHRESVAGALHGAEAAVNLVGVLFESGRQSFDALQAQAPRLIAEEAARAGASRMVQVSAIGADARSQSVYGRTKAEGEAAARAAMPQAVALRPSVVFGEEDAFLNRFAGMAALSPALPLIGGGHTRFQPVYAGDVGAAIAAALARPGVEGRTFELGGPKTYSFRELMQYMLAQIHKRRALVPLPFALAGPMGRAAQLSALVGLPPLMTEDQVELLKRDNVMAAGAAGLADLGVAPTALEAIAPTYLWRYRSGGQFAKPDAGPARAADA